MPCQKRNRMRSIQNGLVESRMIKILLIQVFMQYSRYNKFAINIPGFKQCESDIGTDIPRISIDILGISN